MSHVAIEAARRAASIAGLTGCDSRTGDIALWPGDSGVDAILADECLYYLSRPKLLILLRNCAASLKPDGQMIVVVHSATKHAETLDACRRAMRVIDEFNLNGRQYLVLGRPA